jgi:hypothetical protein
LFQGLNWVIANVDVQTADVPSYGDPNGVRYSRAEGWPMLESIASSMEPMHRRKPGERRGLTLALMVRVCRAGDERGTNALRQQKLH